MYFRPIKRITDVITPVGFVTACRVAGTPTSGRSPSDRATHDGVVRSLSALRIIVGPRSSKTAMHDFVVPTSIPMLAVIVKYEADSSWPLCGSRCDRLRQLSALWA